MVDDLSDPNQQRRRLADHVRRQMRSTPQQAMAVDTGGVTVKNDAVLILDDGSATPIRFEAGEVAKITVGPMQIFVSGAAAWFMTENCRISLNPDYIRVVSARGNISVTDAMTSVEYGTNSLIIDDDGFRLRGVPAAPPGATLNYLATDAAGNMFRTAGGTGGPSGSWAWPFALSTVTSEFGPRDGRFHEGIDFGNPPATLGADIRPFGPGTVEVAGWHSSTGFGNYVIVNHGTVDGKTVKSVYGHMSTLPVVTVGQAVTRETVLGPVGNTGGSFGAHLHAEIHVCPLGGDIVWMNYDPSPSAARTAVNPRGFMAARGV